jgi:cysteine desulfurase
MNLRKEVTQGAIRFSLSRMNTMEEIDYVLGILPPMIERMREISAVRRQR